MEFHPGKWFLSAGVFLAAESLHAQALKDPEFSRTDMRLEKWGSPDSIRITNPNRTALRCDSVAFVAGDSILRGITQFESRAQGGPKRELGLAFYQAKKTRDAGTGFHRWTFPYSLFRLDIPAQGSVDFSWRYFDSCPTCKQAASRSAPDSLRFQMVLYLGPKPQTLDMALDWQLSGAVRRNPRAAPRVRTWFPAEGWDLLGRFRAPLLR